MALVFMDGFDARDVAKKWVTVGGDYSLITATRFGAGYAFRSNAAGIGVLTRRFPAAANIYCGFAIRLNGAYGDGGEFMSLYGDNGTTQHLTFAYTSTGIIRVLRGAVNGTLIATGGSLLTDWQYLEVNATIADAGGTVKVMANGISVIDFTGDTRNAGTSTNLDEVHIGDTSRNNGYDYDDFYLCNNVGTSNNTFLGDVRVQTLIPTGAGASTQFTPTGGANYANVSEYPDNTTTYNASSNVGDRDTYALSNLASGTTGVLGIQENFAAWKADASLGNLKPAMNMGGTVYYGPAVSLGTGVGAWSGAIAETNPATSVAWTPGDVNNMEFGVEVA